MCVILAVLAARQDQERRDFVTEWRGPVAGVDSFGSMEVSQKGGALGTQRV